MNNAPSSAWSTRSKVKRPWLDLIKLGRIKAGLMAILTGRVRVPMDDSTEVAAMSECLTSKPSSTNSPRSLCHLRPRPALHPIRSARQQMTPSSLNVEASPAHGGGAHQYKSGWNPEAVLQTICARERFQNLGAATSSGAEERRPPGSATSIEPGSVDRTRRSLNLGHHAVQPQYHPLTVSYEVAGSHFILGCRAARRARANQGHLAKDAKEWAFYIRKQSSTVRAKGEDERELSSLAATVPFDDRYNQAATERSRRA